MINKIHDIIAGSTFINNARNTGFVSSAFVFLLLLFPSVATGHTAGPLEKNDPFAVISSKSGLDDFVGDVKISNRMIGEESVAAPTLNHLVFSEVLYRDNKSGEWFEIYNPTNQTIDLTGYEISARDGEIYIGIPSGYSIAPGSFFTIVKPSDKDDFEEEHGFAADLYPPGFEVSFNENRDRLRLFNENGLVDLVAWNKNGFRDFNVGRGKAIIRTDPHVDTDTDNDWDVGNEPEGDPRTQATVNQDPVVDINGPYAGTAGQPINFNSTGSSDADGTIVSYTWNFGDGNSSSAANPTHSYSSSGTFTIELTVTDNDGAQASATTVADISPGDFTWSGSFDSAWSNSSNWIGGSTPGITPTSDIIIPSSVNNPVLDTSLNISDTALNISDGGILTVSESGSLTIENSGTILTSGASEIVLNPGSAFINKSDSNPTLRIEQQITGNKGWRMISSPVSTGFDTFLNGDFVTQGFSGSDFPEKQSTLLWWDETEAGTTLQGWRTPNNFSDNVVPGRGYLHYVFNGAGIAGNNDTYSDELPLTLSVTGTEPNLSGSQYSYSNITYTPRDTTFQNETQGAVYMDRIVADQGWNLVGNPTASTINWDASGWTKTNISETIYIWDPNANNGNGDYLVWNGFAGNLNSGKIAPFQSFWVQATGPDPELKFGNEVKESAGNFRGKERRSEKPGITFTLSASGFEKEIWLTFSDTGSREYDKWDAFQLEPMTDSWMAFYTASDAKNSAALTINHQPMDQKNEKTMLDLITGIYKNYEPLEEEFTLKWRRSDFWPEQLNVYLQDQMLESSIEIGAEPDSISFFYHSPELGDTKANNAYKSNGNEIYSAPAPSPITVNPGKFSSSSMPKVTNQGDDQNRFSILISGPEVEDFLPVSPTLDQNYPNPFNPVTTIQFSLPEESEIKLQVFDMLGRLVKTLAQGSYPTGTHRVQWNASTMSSGVYLYRLTANRETILTDKMTLLK